MVLTEDELSYKNSNKHNMSSIRILTIALFMLLTCVARMEAQSMKAQSIEAQSIEAQSIEAQSIEAQSMEAQADEFLRNMPAGLQHRQTQAILKAIEGDNGDLTAVRNSRNTEPEYSDNVATRMLTETMRIYEPKDGMAVGDAVRFME